MDCGERKLLREKKRQERRKRRRSTAPGMPSGECPGRTRKMKKELVWGRTRESDCPDGRTIRAILYAVETFYPSWSHF